MTSSVSDIKLTTGSKCPNCGRTGPLEQHFPCELVAACPRCGYCGECGDLIELPRYGEELTRQQKKQKRYGPWFVKRQEHCHQLRTIRTAHENLQTG